MPVKEISNDLFFTNIRNIIDSGNPVELRVKGTSMYPVFLDGKHKVVLVPCQRQYLRVGVIALFMYNNKYILHRLVSIKGDQLIFQGDNLPYTKECVWVKDIIALVEFIIAPTGEVIDCKKRWFYIKSRLWQPMYKYYSIFIRKIKGFLYKVQLRKI